MQIPYDKLPKGEKTMLMSFAAHWLSIKPALIGDVQSDKELLDRLAAFAKLLHEYFPEENAESGSSYGEAPIQGI